MSRRNFFRLGQFCSNAGKCQVNIFSPTQRRPRQVQILDAYAVCSNRTKFVSRANRAHCVSRSSNQWCNYSSGATTPVVKLLDAEHCVDAARKIKLDSQAETIYNIKWGSIIIIYKKVLKSPYFTVYAVL